MREVDGAKGVRRETATLGGGCFWCLEAVYERLRGIRSVEPGYAGGHVPNPTYRAVCGGGTGHAEVVRITFDPGEISFRDVLDVFFTVHDPTTPNRQGADVGSQYRSIVLYESEVQRRAAEQVVAALEEEDAFGAPIVTEIVPLEVFHPAEAYHREYFRRNPEQAYCRMVIAPKVARLRRHFLERLREPTAAGEP
ncbi:MAG: peptide-methionine (S)-S-oxide reductase MsrA [Candidatus Palauibacterales bacterium]|nr:peptide-methionine (S)-S-oxide reductase MsrA [Candidatus Palauibacterales bacterium]MDP2528840.1 peptide-methionine (S)-S-oxide reductase MsrA [Candidatus Palauibacterales bacterium]